MKTPKNLYFRSVMPKRKSCPSCKTKLNGEQIWSAGEYITGKWRTVEHFCKHCYKEKLAPIVDLFELRNKRKVKFVGYGGEQLPAWLTGDFDGLMDGEEMMPPANF